MKKKHITNAGRQSVEDDQMAISKIRLTPAMLEKIVPHIIKPRRVRNIVRRAVRKSKSQEFTDQLDSILAAVNHIHDLSQQLSAINPSLDEGQRSGAIVRARNQAVRHLENTWRDMLALV